MTIMQVKSLVAATMIIGIAGTSCSNQQPDNGVNEGEQLQLNLSRSDEMNTSDEPMSADIYIFREESLLKTLYVSDTQKETTKISKNVGTGAVYVTSGHPLSVKTGQTTVSEINAIIAYNEADAQSAPLFLSGYTTLDNQKYSLGKMNIEMLRSVARIDLYNVLDGNISINEIVVENAPDATYVFKHDDTAECGTVRYSHAFTTPFKGEFEGVFTIFESSKPVNIRIRGMYDGIPLDMTTTLPTVERNKVYTLQVVNTGAKVETSFVIKDWEEGSTVGAGSITGSRLAIDSEHSIIPEGVTVDYAKNIVSVPYTGAEGMKLAFKADTKINIDKIEGLTVANTVTDNEIEPLAQGYVSSFNVDIDPQGKGRLGYSIFLHLRNALLSQSYDFVEIQVEPSPHQIETVLIGGKEWMCFNATSQDLEEQIYLVDGVENVEEMYNECFETCMGNYFQYLRPNPYSPFTGNDPNAVTKPAVTGWNQPEYMPLPEGYHIASIAEYQALFNNSSNQAVTISATPVEYTCKAGEHIRASIVTLPGTISTSVAAINNQKYLKRYIVFESLDSGNKIFFSMAGLKNTNNSVTPASRFEAAFSYWASDDRYVLYGVTTGSGNALAITLTTNRYNYNGFMTVRGIKNAN